VDVGNKKEKVENVSDDMKIGLEFLNLQSRRFQASVYVEKPLGCLRRFLPPSSTPLFPFLKSAAYAWMHSCNRCLYMSV